MRTTLLIIIGILAGYWNCLVAQHPGELISTKPAKASPKVISSKVLSEICGNNIDDDGNGLRDCEDYSCYYSNFTVCNCVPIDVVWIGDDNGDLFWVNHQTGVEKFVGNMGKIMTDITWSPDGKLYGVDWIDNKIWRIDPATAQVTLVTSIPGYDFSNALTSDASGNLYLASRVALSNNVFHIIRFNIQTNTISVVADLTPTGLFSAGDLAFKNGLLYLACNGNILAGINPSTGAISSNDILGLPIGANIYGIVIKADGTVYLSDMDKLYKLNLSTMQASLYYNCTTPGLYIWGMASFNDYCMAPEAAAICNAKVTINVLSSQPYCTNTGVSLKANGTGIASGGQYKWTFPDGSINTTQNIIATVSGKYKVRYFTTTDSCRGEDSIDLQIGQAPATLLGPDTILCTGSQITFTPTNIADVTSYLWQDGSTNVQLTANQPGLYWLQTWNACGSKRDTVIVTQKDLAKVDLGSNRELCQYDILDLKNLLDKPGYNYTWNDRSTSKSLTIQQPGKYWVEVSNGCGKVSDTIIISKKIDGCECSLFMPTAFTPNGDNKNETIRPFSNCAVTGEMKIFNRWGQIVFQTNDLQQGWNGILNNMSQSSGVYVYYIKYKYTFRPGDFNKKGTFVLIR